MLARMLKVDTRQTPRVTRLARTPVHDRQARFGRLECTIANVSLSGAMLRVKGPIPVGCDEVLALEVEAISVAAKARVVRCEPIEVEMPGGVWRRPDYALGVSFVNPTAEFTAAIRQLVSRGGFELAQPRILVLADGDIARVIESTLSGADYLPRTLTHPSYAARTAKRIGAKAIIIGLPMDSEFSGRKTIEAIRADAATERIPIILCTPGKSWQPAHSTYVASQKVRLLLVPFTPEELVMTVDRTIEQAS